MKLYPRSKKKRIVKKWFKRTGRIRVVCVGKDKESDLYIHKTIVPISLVLLAIQRLNRINKKGS